MAARNRGYFSDLRRQLHLQPKEGDEVLHELEAHVEDKTRELIGQGDQWDAAMTHALDDLGETDELAKELYEVHSRGSWYHTALAVLPHVLLSGMFALHLWTVPIWVFVMLMLAITMSVIGWRLGRPRWAYPWLGYCLMAPIVSWGLAMSAVGYGAWGVLTRGALPLGIPIYAASFIYIAVSLWLVIRFASKVVKPDWVMASLAVLPIPFLAYWLVYFYSRGEALQSSGLRLQEVDSSAAVVFLVIAAATAAFFRIGRRLVRVALLVITTPSLIILAWLSYQGGPSHTAIFLYAVISLAVLLSPALFELRDDEAEQGSWQMEPSTEHRSGEAPT
jgi:hypothetical protein